MANFYSDILSTLDDTTRNDLGCVELKKDF